MHVRRSRLSGMVALAAAMGGLLISALPALAVAPEAPMTEAPLPVGSTTATFQGELVPGVVSGKVSYHFAYSPGAGAGCAESGLTAPAEPFPEAEDSHKKVSVPVTGLEGSTEYSVCLVAANPAEPAEFMQGAPVTFMTKPEKPLIENETSTVTPSSATMEAQVNSENQAIESCVFEYGATVGYGKFASCEPATLGAALTAQQESVHLVNLKPGTTLYYRFAVVNATGETKGAAGVKATTLILEKPIVSGETVGAIDPFAASVEAVVNPNYQETTYEVEYASNEQAVLKGEGAKVSSGTLASEFAEQPVSVALESLTPATPYFYRVVATNRTGTTDGPIKEFKTSPLEAPLVSSEGVTGDGATLDAVVNPNYQETTYVAEYATAEARIGTPAATTVVGGSSLSEFYAQSVSVKPGELEPDTTYYYRIVATNATGATPGPIEHFTTLALPLATTEEAYGVTSTTAMLSGAVNPDGSQTSYHFAYVPVSEYEPSAANPYARGATSSDQVSGNDESVHQLPGMFVGGLKPGTSYDYALVANNKAGTASGSVRTFTTLPPGEPPSPPPAPSGAGGAEPVPPSVFPLIPYTPISQLNAREAKEGKATIPGTGVPTRSQKLAAALRACHKKAKAKRSGCEKTARKKYGPTSKKNR